jgi:3-phenylpropionate/trans-cinnamate dioxygenase ferredoxin subunit
MEEKKYQWFKVAESVKELRFSSNNMLIVEANHKKVTLVKYKEQFYACAHLCPHASGVLSEGHIDVVGNVVCPVHRYKFSLQNGRNVSGEGYCLRTYPVKVTDEGVFVGIMERGFLNFR